MPRITEREYREIPEVDARLELVGGIVVAEPFPRHRHDRVRKRLERALDAYLEAHPIGEVFGDIGYLLATDPDTVRRPDLSFVEASRLAGFDDETFFEGAPDLAIEILSPSNRPREIRERTADYLAAGCRLVWILDPKTRTVTVHGPGIDAIRRDASGILDGAGVLPGFSVPVERLFPS